MRILFVSECYPSDKATQYGIFIKQQADALSKLGNVVDVLVPFANGENGKIEYKEGAYRVTYKTIRYELFPVFAARLVYRQIEKLIKENSYDLVAVHITSDAILKMVVKACNRLKVSVVAHYHGLNVWEEYVTTHPHRQKWYASRRRRILKRTNGVVGVSEKVSEIVRSRLEDVPVFTVYNGVDVEMFLKSAPDKESFRIISVGNLIKIKGFNYLLDAFAKLLEKVPHATLDIVGDGVEKEALLEQAKELGVATSVSFHGKLPYEQVAAIMQRSNLFVLPSFYEALGCVYLEAMGCALPTIGVLGMGIDEVITHGENGLLVKPKDSDDLYEKMLLVATDESLAKKLGEEAFKTASGYTWSESAKRLSSVYEECKF